MPTSSPVAFARGIVFALLLLLVIPACGGGAGGADPFEETFPVPDAPGGGGGGGTTPPPAPPQTPTWNANAAAYGRTALFGSFASDIVRYGDTLFVTDADAVEGQGARILAFDVSGAAPVASSTFATTTILAGDLRDSTGSAGNAGNAAAPIGFGFFLDDITIVSPTLGFVLVNAGGSDSAPTLSNLVAFNPTSGQVLQVVDLTNLYTVTDVAFDSAGNPMQGVTFAQAGAEAIGYVPTGTLTGALYVAMSNLVFGAPSNGATKLPGTIQVLNVNAADALPLTFASNGGGGAFVIRTQAFNPIAIDVLTLPPPAPTFTPKSRLLVTCAGTTDFDMNFNLVPTTPSAVESYDAATGVFEGAFGLGLAGLAATRPALGHDGAGHFVGFFPSSVTGEVYLLRLDGLLQDPINTSTLAVLRGPFNGIPITAAQAGGPGGNLTGVALSPDGRTLAVAGFGDLFAFPEAIPGQLFLVGLPFNLLTGDAFGTDFTPGSTLFASTPGRTLGGVVLVPNDGTRPDVFTNVSGTLDENFLGNGGASLGSLQTYGLIR